MNLENKWIRAAIPALLIHCSIGTVYCWSTFKDAIAKTINASPFSVGWAFSLAIFFLGISAAFFGKKIEQDVHKSALVACICFTCGLIGTALTITFLKGIPALIGLYISYGCVMGIGLGIGYLTPVKTLMLWFKDNKGLATGISIMGFGLAKVLATPLMEILQSTIGIANMFFVLSGLYFVMMGIGFLLLKKPSNWVEISDKDNNFKLKDILKNPLFIGIWIIFFLNIHCGLMLITYEKQLLITFGFCSMVAIIPSFSAAFNAGGRLGYATLSDKVQSKFSIYQIIFTSSLFASGLCAGGILLFKQYWLIIPMLFIINAGYGGGFSTLPNLLQDKFGMVNISKIHGCALTAWAIAGLTGNNTTALLLRKTTFLNVIIIVELLYFVAYCIIEYLVIRNKEKGDTK